MTGYNFRSTLNYSTYSYLYQHLNSLKEVPPTHIIFSSLLSNRYRVDIS